MFRKGFIESQIEELGRLMAKILAALTGRNYDDSKKLIEEKLAESGIRFDELLGLDERELVLVVSAMPAFSPENIEAFADVIASLAEKASDAQLYRKSLALYEFVNTSERTFSIERNAKIDRIKSRL